MLVQFMGYSRLTVEPVEGSSNKLTSVEIALEPSHNLDHSKYEDPATGELTNAGARVLTSCYVQGLAMCVKIGIQKGYFTLAEVKEILLKELETSAEAPASCITREFDPTV